MILFANRRSSRVRNGTLAWLLVGLVPSVSAQSNWELVKTLQGGATVRVETTGGQVRGAVASASDAGLSIEVSGRVIDVARADVRRIVRIGERPIKRYMLRGAAIGAAGGATLGALAAETNKGLWSAVLAAGWTGVGALIGAVEGLTSHTENVVYQV